MGGMDASPFDEHMACGLGWLIIATRAEKVKSSTLRHDAHAKMGVQSSLSKSVCL